MAASVNGRLLENVAHLAKHADADCVDLLRKGWQLYGMLPRSGLGEELECGDMPSADSLREGCRVHKAALLGSVREDPHAAELLRCDSAGMHIKFPVA